MKIRTKELIVVIFFSFILTQVMNSHLKERQTCNVGTGYYFIITFSSKCLDIQAKSLESRAKIIQNECQSGDNQKWIFIRKSDDSYVVKSKLSEKVMDISGASLEKGTEVIQFTEHSRANQRFRIEPSGNGCKIVNINSTLCLDIKGASTDNSTPLIQWDCHGGQNQIFNFSPS